MELGSQADTKGPSAISYKLYLQPSLPLRANEGIPERVPWGKEKLPLLCSQTLSIAKMHTISLSSKVRVKLNIQHEAPENKTMDSFGFFSMAGVVWG